MNHILFLCLFLLLALSLLPSHARGEVTGEEKEGNEEEGVLDFQKMKMKQLRKFLKDRGLECKGCAEKNDFVKMAEENRNAPLQKKEKNEKSSKTSPEGASFDGNANINDLLNQMKKMGMNGNVFTKDDLEKMNRDGKGYEDMFKSSGGTGKTPNRRSKKSKIREEDRANAESREQGSETIEL